MDELDNGVGATQASSSPAESTAVSAPADSSEATQPQAAAPDESQEGAAAPFQVPENDDDLKGKENQPYVAGIIELRQELRERNQRLDEFKPWRDVVTQIGDPTIAKDYYELMQTLHSPVEGQPDEFTTRPFIEKLDSMSPGAANALLFDLLGYQVADENGRMDSMVRHMYRSHGLDPDRVEDYRNIDTIRASGAVTSDDLAGIPERFHDAFRALSTTQRDDILAQRQLDATGRAVYSPAAMEYLQDKAEALEARQWRERDEQARAQQAEVDRQQFEQQLQTEILQDVTTEAQSIRDSILQNLSSQVTFSSDPLQDKLTKAGIMALVQQVQSPYPYQQQAALAMLKEAGIEPNGFGELLNRFEERRGAYKRFEAMGDQLQARRALSEATVAKQQILARANDYTLRLAQANGERVAAQASQQAGQLQAATARFVPSGSQAQQGSTNPYEDNPYPIGSQEYFAYNRRLDKEYKLTGASMFGS